MLRSRPSRSRRHRSGLPTARELQCSTVHGGGTTPSEENGIALCSLHHKLFDRGAFTVSSERKVLVSEQVNGSVGVNEWLLQHHGTGLVGPQRSSYLPDESYLDWHTREVFRGPPRETTG